MIEPLSKQGRVLECHIGDIIWMLCKMLKRRWKAYYWNMTEPFGTAKGA